MGSITKTDGRHRVDDIFYMIGKISFFPVCLFGIWFAVNGYASLPGVWGNTGFFPLFPRRILGEYPLKSGRGLRRGGIFPFYGTVVL